MNHSLCNKILYQRKVISICYRIYYCKYKKAEEGGVGYTRAVFLVDIHPRKGTEGRRAGVQAVRARVLLAVSAWR